MTDTKKSDQDDIKEFLGGNGLSVMKIADDVGVISRPMEGEVVIGNPGVTLIDEIGMPHMSSEEVFQRWLSYMDESPAGIEPVIGQFLKENPAFISPAAMDMEGALPMTWPALPKELSEQEESALATPREWERLSQLILGLNRSVECPQKGQPWIAPVDLVDSFIREPARRALLDFAKNLGLDVNGEKQTRRLSQDDPAP